MVRPAGTPDGRSFADLGVPERLVDQLAADGIAEPFPVQALVIPDGLAGRDITVKAPTGSGKTLAFGLPLVALVGQAAPHRPRALVLAPTRELAQQIADVLAPLAASYDRRVAAFFGGTGYTTQTRALRKGLDVAVGCPGRLEDLISSNTMSLADVDIVVVDEADRMADMGFLPSVRRLLDQVRPNRQTMLFSATLDGDVDEVVRAYQRDPVHHELAIDDNPSGDVDHRFVQVTTATRLRTAAKVVAAHGPTVVFCRTRLGADRVARQLSVEGINAVAIHGDRSQRERDAALASFSAGRADALVATDVAARGIHVDDVACVVHYDPPADAKDYVHRSGRTGRAGGDGTVISLVLPAKERAVEAIRAETGHVGGYTAMADLPAVSASAGTPRSAPLQPLRRRVGAVGTVPIRAPWLPDDLAVPLRRPRPDPRRKPGRR